MRTKLRGLIAALALSLTVASVTPVAAREDKPNFEQRLETLAKEGVDTLRRALEKMRDRLKPYLPYAAPNGDIVIPRPRLHDSPAAPPTPKKTPRNPVDT